MTKFAGLISTADEIARLAETLRTSEIIAIDTEFIRETTFYPIVEILQIATATDSWLVDAQAFKRGFKQGPRGGYAPGLKPLFEVLEDPKILKIVHAAQGDQECLYTSFCVVARPTLDTAVAASLCGFGDGVGLGKLLKQVLNVSIKKGHARTNWSVRPLPEQLVEYAHSDVEHLVELGRKLMEHLDGLGRRQWAMELSSQWENPSLYEPDSSVLAKKLARGGRLDKRGYAVLHALVRWREERVRQLNLPRRWVAEDAVLLDLAHVRPASVEHLGAFRGLNKGELKNSGEAILSAIRDVTEAEDVVVSKSDRNDVPTVEESQVIDLLRCFTGILASRHKIAAKHLMTSAQLLPLLRVGIKQPKDLVDAGILSEDAAGLIGEELIAVIQGRRALRVDGSRVHIIEVGASGT
jgi:ribonuclease D